MSPVNSGGPYERKPTPPALPPGWRMRGAMPDGASFRVPKSDVDTGLSPFASAYRSTPVRPPERADWSVPLMQSVLTGLVVGLPAGWMAAYVVRYVFDVDPVTGLWMLFGFVGSVMFVWLWRLGAHSGLLMRVEEITGLDINQDGQKGPPQPPGVDVTVKHEQGGYERWEFDNLRGSKRKGHAGLITFARAIVLSGDSFAERQANEYGGYSRAEWEELRDIFINHGWARWVNEAEPRQGVELTYSGRAVLRRIAGEGMPRQQE